VWAIINGEDHTGVTLFRIAEGVDSGDVIDQQSVSIGPDEVIEVVLERVSLAYLELLERNLPRLLKGDVRGVPQDHSLATYTCKRLPDDNAINWSDSTENIFNLIRAVSAPYPGAYTQLSGKVLRIWKARRLVSGSKYVGRIPGRVVAVTSDEGSIVLTGDGALLIEQVQLERSPVMPAAEVLNKLSMTLGR